MSATTPAQEMDIVERLLKHAEQCDGYELTVTADYLREAAERLRDARAAVIEEWESIETAPKDATWIVGRYQQSLGNFYYMAVHWADGGGDDQPRFRGWFSWSGGSGGFHQVKAPDDWQPIRALANRSALPSSG